MAVTGGEVGAGHPDRQEQRAAGAKLLVVQVAAVLPRLLGRDRAIGGGRRHSHDTEERGQLQLGAPGQPAGAGGTVHGDVAQEAVREVLRQGAGERAVAAEAPIGAELDAVDADLQRVAGFGARDGDRAGQDVRAEPGRVRGVDGGERRRHLEAQAFGRHHVRPA